MIFQHWIKKLEKHFGRPFPRDYLCFDLETTGLTRDNDFIVEIGHALVHDGKLVNKMNLVLNWIDHPLIESDELFRKMAFVKRKMGEQGKQYHMTGERMRKEGVAPEKAIEHYCKMFNTVVAQNQLLVAHNGWGFDTQMFEGNCRALFGIGHFKFKDDYVFDTGAIVKASQLLGHFDILPRDSETLRTYAMRVHDDMRQSGVKWSLDNYCVPTYQLVEKYGIDTSQMHKAGDDAYITHLLVEELYKRSNDGPDHAPLVAPEPDKGGPFKPPKDVNDGSGGVSKPVRRRRRGQRNR